MGAPPPSLTDRVKANATATILLGVLTAILGATALTAPFWSSVAAALLVGCGVLVAGVAQCVFALRSASAGHRLLGLLAGIGTGLCGVVMLAHPLLNLGLLTRVLAGYFAVAGVFEGVQALRLRPLGGWRWVLAGSGLSLALAAAIHAQWPLSGDLAIALAVATKVLLLGASMVVVGRAARVTAAK